jgi:hypothetical protein
MPGLVCQFITIPNTLPCSQGAYIEPFVCCDAILPYPEEAGPGFVPGSGEAACLQALPNQDPACAIPLDPSCAHEGLVCRFQRSATFTYSYATVCCGGRWVAGESCPADAGSD